MRILESNQKNMREGHPPNREKKQFNAGALDFSQLERAYALAHNTFKRTENGFVSVDGDIIEVRNLGENWVLSGLSSNNREALQQAMYIEPPTSLLRTGSSDKQKMLDVLQELLLKTGNRIIR